MLSSIHSAEAVGLHFSVAKCQGKVLTGLPWHRVHAKLLQQTQVIPVGPFFDDLPVCDTDDGHPCRCDLLPGWGNAHKWPQVCATCRITVDDLVPFCHLIFNREVQVGAGCEVHREELFVGVNALDGHRGVMIHDVRGTQFIGEGQVPLV